MGRGQGIAFRWTVENGALRDTGCTECGREIQGLLGGIASGAATRYSQYCNHGTRRASKSHKHVRWCTPVVSYRSLRPIMYPGRAASRRSD